MHCVKKGFNTVDESQNDEWDEWGSWRHDSLGLSYAGKSKGKGCKWEKATRARAREAHATVAKDIGI